MCILLYFGNNFQNIFINIWLKITWECHLESPLIFTQLRTQTHKFIREQPVRSEGDQPWDFFGRDDVKAETPVLWPLHAKSWLTGKDSDAGRDWGQEEKGDDRGWDGWMSSPTRWTWVWVNSGSWWWTGRPGVLQFMGSQSWTRLSDWTELNWTVVYTREYSKKVLQGKIFDL